MAEFFDHWLSIYNRVTRLLNSTRTVSLNLKLVDFEPEPPLQIKMPASRMWALSLAEIESTSIWVQNFPSVGLDLRRGPITEMVSESAAETKQRRSTQKGRAAEEAGRGPTVAGITGLRIEVRSVSGGKKTGEDHM